MDYARAAGKVFEITRETPTEYRAWVRYFNLKGMFDQMKRMLRWFSDPNLPDKWAVPAQWPWQFDQSVSEHMHGDYATAKWGVPGKAAKPVEAKDPKWKASCDAFLEMRGVIDFPPEHDLRRAAVAEWARLEMRKPLPPDAFANMAEKDPNRLGAPKGWKGVMNNGQA